MLDKFNDIQERARRLFAFSIMYLFSLVSPGSIKYKYKKILVSWFARLKNRLFKPFRDLKEKIKDKAVSYVEAHKAKKLAEQETLFRYMRKATEDCVVLYPEKNLGTEAIRFFHTREVGVNLKWALRDYLKNNPNPEEYGERMNELFTKGHRPKYTKEEGWAWPPSNGVIVYDSAIPAISIAREPRNEATQNKTQLNQKMWEYKKCHQGLTPREYAIKDLKANILHLEGVLAGNIPKATVRVAWQEEDLANIDKFKEKLAKMEASDEFYDWNS